MELVRYNQLKQQAEQAQREADRQAGVLTQLKAKLKEEFGVTSLSDAKALLKKLQGEQRDAEQQYEQALDQFLEAYPEFEEDG